jgi:glucuronosyltransferase
VTQAFISAFARLEQKVIMRFDPKFLTNVPDNVMVVNWVPQQDILGLIC